MDQRRNNYFDDLRRNFGVNNVKLLKEYKRKSCALAKAVN